MSDGSPSVASEIRAFYERIDEATRLHAGDGLLERERTQEIVLRFLPGGALRVADVGGGPGEHACWLAGLGHDVALVDAVPRHVEQAAARAAADGLAARVTCAQGDARALPLESGSCDAVLLLGPLYHLTERADRLAALREARRVVRPGGVVFAAGISRAAALLDGLRRELLDDDRYVSMARRDIEDGRHSCPPGAPWFTTAYMHRPEELAVEMTDASLDVVLLAGIEGPGMWLPDLAERWAEPVRREQILMTARLLESEPSVRGVSAHLLGVAERPKS